MTAFLDLCQQNTSKVFSVSLEVFHPISCLIIDYNDGSKEEVYGIASLCQAKYPAAIYQGGPITNPFNVSHVYQWDTIKRLSFNYFLYHFNDVSLMYSISGYLGKQRTLTISKVVQKLFTCSQFHKWDVWASDIAWLKSSWHYRSIIFFHSFP